MVEASRIGSGTQRPWALLALIQRWMLPVGPGLTCGQPSGRPWTELWRTYHPCVQRPSVWEHCSCKDGSSRDWLMPCAPCYGALPPSKNGGPPLGIGGQGQSSLSWGRDKKYNLLPLGVLLTPRRDQAGRSHHRAVDCDTARTPCNYVLKTEWFQPCESRGLSVGTGHWGENSTLLSHRLALWPGTSQLASLGPGSHLWGKMLRPRSERSPLAVTFQDTKVDQFKCHSALFKCAER